MKKRFTLFSHSDIKREDTGSNTSDKHQETISRKQPIR